MSKTNSELMKRYEKRTKKQPKIKKQNQKKSKKHEKTQNKKTPKNIDALYRYKIKTLSNVIQV